MTTDDLSTLLEIASESLARLAAAVDAGEVAPEDARAEIEETFRNILS